MKLQVLLSVMNLNKRNLDKMNIANDCIVINQTDKEKYEEYKNFKIFSYNEKGAAKSRNRALEICDSDIAIFCDDDVVYNNEYENIIINEFNHNKDADVIFFNLYSPFRKDKINRNNRRVRIYNALRYGSYKIAFRVKSIKDNNIKLNELFGSGALYSNGDDTLFIVECLKKKLKLYKSTKFIGTVTHTTSLWFDGYNERYFFLKGALFYAISKRYYKFLCTQYLLRHKNVLKDIKFNDAYKYMMNGVNDFRSKYE